jgi:vitamin B12 transporter
MKFLLLSVALAATPAVAQTLPDDDEDAVVVTASRVEQAADETGQAITVIRRDEIERRQTTVISDLLATTPGVTVTRNGGVGGFTGVRIRGADAEQTLVVIDGVRVNDPSSPGGGFDFANLLSSSVERIEVLRGPNSVPWGSQAIGGVVNIVTGQPRDGLQARAAAEYGYADTGFLNAGISGARGGLSGALSGGYLRSDGISTAASGTERDGYRQYGASGRLGYEAVPGVGVDLRGYYADSRTELDGFPAPSFTLGDTDEYSTTRELYGYAGLHANLADGRATNRIAFTIADVDRDNYDPASGPEPSFIGRGRSERYEYQGDFRPLDAVRIVAGAEHETSRYADDIESYSVGVTSVYGELILKPVAGLTVSGGIRNDDHDAYGSQTTLGADAALALPTGTTLRASYGEGFKAPTLYQLYGPFGFADLVPETARNYDAGIEQSFIEGRARVSATYFNRRTSNQIDFDLVSFTYANIARTRAQGVELTLALRPVDALNLTANYSYIDSENRSDGANRGNDLARRPRETLSATVDYRFPFGVSVGATVSHVGDSFDDAANRSRLDGYVLASIRGELPIGERLAIYARVDNLTDQRYQVVRGYGTYGRAAYGGVRVRLD